MSAMKFEVDLTIEYVLPTLIINGKTLSCESVEASISGFWNSSKNYAQIKRSEEEIVFRSFSGGNKKFILKKKLCDDIVTMEYPVENISTIDFRIECYCAQGANAEDLTTWLNSVIENGDLNIELYYNEFRSFGGKFLLSKISKVTVASMTNLKSLSHE